MSTAVPPRPVHADWKTLYHAAILETEKSVVKQKISAAITAVLSRQKELFGCGSSDEKEALEEALYLLRAYRNAWENCEEVSGTAPTPPPESYPTGRTPTDSHEKEIPRAKPEDEKDADAHHGRAQERRRTNPLPRV